MEITRKINNNVALGVDSNGREIVVCGKGIGFPKMPYTLTDMSQVQRTYYDISAHNVRCSMKFLKTFWQLPLISLI